MSELAFSDALVPGDPLAWWQLADIDEQLFLADPEPLTEEIQARFVTGFRGVGDLPCRKLFRSTMADREVDLPERIDWTDYELGTRQLEFSSFWHVPTHVQRFARTVVDVERAGEYRLDVETCGGVRVWVNRSSAARFTPFTRNQLQTQKLHLALGAGRNELVLHLEELCERDTTWATGLTWMDHRPARLALPARGGAMALLHLAALAHGLRLDREAHLDEQPVVLLLPEPARIAITFRLRGIGRGNAIPEIPERSVQVEPGTRSVDFGPGSSFPEGHHQLGVTLEARGMRLGRKLGAGFAQPDRISLPALEIAARKRAALEHVARHGGPQIGRALALLVIDEDRATCRALVKDALGRIERREDCSDFWMPPLLWLLRDWPDEVLGRTLRDRATRAILGWRYWLDEPGNDVMWFWSENHVLCCRTAQYLAGQAYPDDVFVNSGRTGREQRAIGRERLEHWFADVEANGFVEWHSPAYYPIDMIGLLALRELADDPALRARAERTLDRLFLLIALSTLAGIPSSSQGRTYDRDLKLVALTETAALAWIAWGKGGLGPLAYAVPLFCLSGYEPPDAARRLALWDEPNGFEARYVQGGARLVTWKGRDALLGSVADYHPGMSGYQAVVTQAHLEGHPDARIWINHPGQDDPFGTRRPSYWAGDGIMPRAAQWRDLALLHYRLGEGCALPWTHAYVRHDAYDEILLEDPWLFVRAGRGLAAVMAANGLRMVEEGPTAGYEVRSPGVSNTWLLKVASIDRFGSLATFASAMRCHEPRVVPGTEVAFADAVHGELRFAWSGTFTVAGQDRRHDVSSVAPLLTLDDGRTVDLDIGADGTY